MILSKKTGNIILNALEMVEDDYFYSGNTVNRNLVNNIITRFIDFCFFYWVSWSIEDLARVQEAVSRYSNHYQIVLRDMEDNKEFYSIIEQNAIVEKYASIQEVLKRI